MTDTAPTARDIDHVPALDGLVKARESGQEAHRKRRSIAEAQGWRLADGEELPRDGIATFASAPLSRDPATIAVQIGHRGHRVADSHAAHVMARGDDAAGKVEAKNDGGVRPMKLRSASLYSSGLSDEAATRINISSAAGRGTGRRTASSGSPAPISRVADAKKRLRDRMCLLHVWLS
jgi:hypothetical protein